MLRGQLREQLLQDERYSKMYHNDVEQKRLEESKKNAPVYKITGDSPLCVQYSVSRNGKELIGFEYMGTANVDEGGVVNSRHIHKRNFDGALFQVYYHVGLRRFYRRTIKLI